jgi:hypothetical protein
MTNESDTHSPEQSKELRILRLVKKTLTDVAKDTYTPPQLKHPLSEDTINSIRQCLELITARESELTTADEGLVTSSKPRFIDEPTDTVVVKLEPTGKPEKN